MKITNKQYDTLKWVASSAFPAFIALVTTVGTALNWGHTQVVTIVLAAFNAFLGDLLRRSTNKYNEDDPAVKEGSEMVNAQYDLRKDDK